VATSKSITRQADLVGTVDGKTSAYTDPANDMIGILLTQRMMDSPNPPRVFSDFWTLAYAAMDDAQ
jgi:hypothetical protein